MKTAADRGLPPRNPLALFSPLGIAAREPPSANYGSLRFRAPFFPPTDSRGPRTARAWAPLPTDTNARWVWGGQYPPRPPRRCCMPARGGRRVVKERSILSSRRRHRVDRCEYFIRESHAAVAYRLSVYSAVVYT
ncbi:hypothetical protein MRX96_013332 [Rhipicephalus microplus]